MKKGKEGLMQNIFKSYFQTYQGLPARSLRQIFISFITTIASSFAYYLSIYFVSQKNLKIDTAGFLLSCYGFGTVVGGILGGKLSDKISPRRISIICLLIEAISVFALVGINSTTIMAINLFLMGIAFYGFKTSNTMIVLRPCKHNEEIKIKALNILYVISNLGLGISAVIISIIGNYSFSYIFYPASFLLLSAATINLSEELKFCKHAKRFKLKPQIKTQKTRSQIKTSVWKKISPILITLFLIGLVIAQRRATYPVFIQQLFPGMGLESVGILLALNPILIVFTQTPIVQFFSKFNKVLIIGSGAFLMGFGTLILSFSPLFSMAFLAGVIYTFGEMLFFSLAQLVCYNYAEKSEKGNVLGVFQTVYALSIVAGPVLGGVIYHHYGSTLLWYLSGTIGVCCLVLCIIHYIYSKY